MFYFFRIKPFFWFVPIVVFILFFSCCKKWPQKQPDNIILIVVDAMRADHLSFTGYTRKTTPVIDSLVENAAVCQNAYSQSNWTCPSMASLFSGTYPLVHKVYNLPSKIQQHLSTLPEKLIIIPEFLKEHGFYTGGITSLGWVSPETNYQGFDEFKLVIRTDKKKTQETIQFITKNKDRKFFLYLHYLDLHDYFWPRHSEGKYISPPYDLSESLKNLLSQKPAEIYRELKKYKNFTPGELQYLKDKYDSLLFRTDELIGWIINSLKEENIWDNTLVIVTADHGENFFEHQEMTHGGFSLYNEVLHIPLIFHNRMIFKERKDIKELTESIDIYPTLLHILDLPQVILDGENQNQGNSIFKPQKDKTVMIENSAMNRIKIINGNWSYIFHPVEKKGELYNLAADPLEAKNLIDIDVEVTRRMHKLLEAKIASCRKLGEKVETEKSELDEATRKKLKSLGYIK